VKNANAVIPRASSARFSDTRGCEREGDLEAIRNMRRPKSRRAHRSAANHQLLITSTTSRVSGSQMMKLSSTTT
jgi:hypothetical protein